MSSVSNTCPRARRRSTTLPSQITPTLPLFVQMPVTVRCRRMNERARFSFHPIRMRVFRAESGMSHTYYAFLPGPKVWPPLHKVLHDEDVGDDALVVPERQSADRGEGRAGEHVLVLQKSCETGWAITIGVRVRILRGRSRI